MADDSTIGRLFSSGSVVEQIAIWGVLYETVRLALQPFFNELSQQINSQFQTVPISPPDLATLYQRSAVGLDFAHTEAAKSGTSPDNLDLLVYLRRLPPGVQQVIQMAYRGVVGWDASGPKDLSVQNAVRESDISNDWYPAIRAYFDLDAAGGGESIPISVVVDATVEGQVDYATGERLARDVGVSPDRFRIMFNTRGNPPGPAELIELVRRGFIPLQGVGPDQTTLQQGVFEGATKDKWEPLYEKLVDYLPPPRTVTALQRAGAISTTEALSLYEQQGLSSDLAAAYVQNASNDKLEGSKQLAESIITKLYYDKAIDAPTATQMLAPLGYDANEAAFILEVQDLSRVTTAVNSAITRLGSLYIAHKIDAQTTRNGLASLGVSSAQVDQLLSVWVIEAASNLKVLTQAEIVDAAVGGIITNDDALAELESLGYSPYDAWILLSLKYKAPQGTAPAKGPNPPQTLGG